MLMSLWEIPGNVREFDEDWRVAARLQLVTNRIIAPKIPFVIF